MSRNPLNLTKPERSFIGIVGLLGFILDSGSSKLIHHIMPIGRDLAMTWGMLRICGNLLLAAVFAFVIYRMLNVFRRRSFTPKRILAIVACVMFVLFLIVVNILRYNAVIIVNQYLKTTYADLDKSVLKKLDQDLPPEKRSKLSFLHAKSVFADEGRIIDYLSPENKPVRFEPSSEDRSNRNLILFQQTQSGSEKMIATAISVSWLIAFFGAFISGFMSTKSEGNMS